MQHKSNTMFEVNSVPGRENGKLFKRENFVVHKNFSLVEILKNVMQLKMMPLIRKCKEQT